MPTPRERDPDARWGVLALAGIVVLAALLRFPGRAVEDLWFDEVFSVVLASQDLPELFRRAIADQTNPPGFYLALWAWTRLGSLDTAWVRSLPALAGTLTVPAVVLLARALGGRWRAALLAGWLAAVSPLLIAMSSEARAYAPLALTTAVTLALAARIARRESPPARGELVALAGVELVLISLHFFGALVVAALIVATRWTAPARVRPVVLASTPAAAALLTWIVIVVGAAGADGVGGNAEWIAPPGPSALRSFGSHAIGTFGTGWGAWTVTLLLTAAVAVGAYRARPESPTRVATGADEFRARWLLTTALLPLAIVFGLSAASSRSLWLARYLIIALPPLWLLVADAVLALSGRSRTAAIAALAAWTALAGPLAERARPAKPSWALIARALGGGAPATVCVNEPYLGLPLQYYALADRVPLRVLRLEECAVQREGMWALVRPETDASLERIRRAGATLGEARSLGTSLPMTELRMLHWR